MGVWGYVKGHKPLPTSGCLVGLAQKGSFDSQLIEGCHINGVLIEYYIDINTSLIIDGNKK